MTPQRQRIAGLERALRDAKRDGEPAARVANLAALLAAEKAILQGSREPGACQTVAEAAAEAADNEE